MKRSYHRPTRRTWLTYIAMFFIGFILTPSVELEPSAWEKAASFLSTTLMGASIGGSIATYRELKKYRKQSPEERRDADLAATDERLIAIEGRAARVALDVTSSLLAVMLLLLAAFDQDVAMWACAGVLFVGCIAFLLALRWFNKRM